MKTNTNSGNQDAGQSKNNDVPNQPEAKKGAHNLSYNKSEGSFEFDIKPEDGEYNHPDPYNTAVKNGGDADSDYDSANPTAVDEYEPKANPEEGYENLGMTISNGKFLDVDPLDEELSKTPEDDRDDLDEEGYPKNDKPR